MNQLENLYREVIMEHYKHPRNKGLISNEAYIKIRHKNPSCGDDVTIQTLIEGQTIRDCRFEGHGCSICCASASVLTETMIGKNVDEARDLTDRYLRMVSGAPNDMDQDLGGAEVFSGVRQFPARIKCASISWQAFLKTLEGGAKNDE